MAPGFVWQKRRYCVKLEVGHRRRYEVRYSLQGRNKAFAQGKKQVKVSFHMDIEGWKGAKRLIVNTVMYMRTRTVR